MRVGRPKGEGVYGTPRIVPILGHVRPALEEFMNAREEYLARHGIANHPAFVPYCATRGAAMCFTQAEWAKVKAELEETSGVRFKLKDFRSTFCQNAIDRCARL